MNIGRTWSYAWKLAIAIGFCGSYTLALIVFRITPLQPDLYSVYELVAAVARQGIVNSMFWLLVLFPIIGILRWVMRVDMRRCPFCEEWVRPTARVCKHCRRDLPPLEKRSRFSGNEQVFFASIGSAWGYAWKAALVLGSLTLYGQFANGSWEAAGTPSHFVNLSTAVFANYFVCLGVLFPAFVIWRLVRHLDQKACPYCSEYNAPSAVRCRHCDRELIGSSAPATTTLRLG